MCGSPIPQAPLLSEDEVQDVRRRLILNAGSVLKKTSSGRPAVTLSDALEELNFLSKALTHEGDKPFLSGAEVKLAKKSLFENMLDLNMRARPSDNIVVHR